MLPLFIRLLHKPSTHLKLGVQSFWGDASLAVQKVSGNGPSGADFKSDALKANSHPVCRSRNLSFLDYFASHHVCLRNLLVDGIRPALPLMTKTEIAMSQKNNAICLGRPDVASRGARSAPRPNLGQRCKWYGSVTSFTGVHPVLGLSTQERKERRWSLHVFYD